MMRQMIQLFRGSDVGAQFLRHVNLIDGFRCQLYNLKNQLFKGGEDYVHLAVTFVQSVLVEGLAFKVSLLSLTHSFHGNGHVLGDLLLGSQESWRDWIETSISSSHHKTSMCRLSHKFAFH